MSQSPTAASGGRHSSSPVQPNFADNSQDDRESLPSVVEETQNTKPLPPKTFRFSSPCHDISESALVEGFTFQPRQAPRPGQYTGITGPSKCNEPQAVGERQQGQASIWSQHLPDLLKPQPGDPELASSLKLPEIQIFDHSHCQQPAQSDKTWKDNPPGSVATSSIKSQPRGPHVTTPAMSRGGSSRSSNHRAECARPVEQGSVESTGFELPHRISPGHQTEHGCYQKSVPSFCDDLERPKPVTSDRPQHKRREGRHGFHDMRPVSHKTRARDSRHRSGSKSSNISKKRSAAGEPQPRRESRRKQDAMRNVAEYWNECIRISEEEVDDLHYRNDRLREQVVLHRRQMNEAERIVRQQQGHIQDMEGRYKVLEMRDSHLSEQNNGLTQQVEDLRHKLSGVKSHMSEKCTNLKLKLNEAIEEQQRLFIKSQTDSRNIVASIEEEKTQRASERQRFDEALERSIQQRTEMKELLTEHQRIAEQEIQRSKFQPHVPAYRTSY